MIESKEAAFELLIPYKYLPKAIEPAMRNLYDPPFGWLHQILPLLVVIRNLKLD